MAWPMLGSGYAWWGRSKSQAESDRQASGGTRWPKDLGFNVEGRRRLEGRGTSLEQDK